MGGVAPSCGAEIEGDVIMAGTKIEIAASDGSGSFAAYRSGPETSDKGIVVIQEIFGVNASIREVADQWGAAGYATVAPDLFWRVEPGMEIDSTIEAERERAMGIYRAFDLETGIADCIATIAELRGHCAKVGVIGFCLGGRLAYHMATRSDADACIGYYGVGIETVLEEATDGVRPMLQHFGETDELCGPEARAQIYKALEGLPDVELHTYENAGHAFGRATSVNFDAAAKQLADERTGAFLARHVG